ncbi:MAG: TIGR00730 family Rossman fold protein [Minwuia sp.]|uniref:LOG family protein n=1 Tax=Minwuia sp. TaxID=2493630 RepID=UPI003A8C5A08
MTDLKSICVYCGSSSRAAPDFLDAAERLGRLIGSSGRALVYGGGRLGLMGRVADGALSEGGRVIGIIPEHLHKVEVQHDDVTELLIVDTMHTRKAEMVRRSDGFVVLPGGIGTLDELIEILSWRQLGLHGKPIVIVDQHGYFTPFRQLMDHIVAENFAAPAVADYVSYVDTVEAAVDALEDARSAGIEVRLDKI